MSQVPKKTSLHPRNRFRNGYDFSRLIEVSPGLTPFVATNAYGNLSVDFANPAAVKALNQALLQSAYGAELWDIPDGYLCPPIPGRSDLIHSVADLLGEGSVTGIPKGPQIRLLDIGVGANCIYPLLAAFEYGWSSVGTEIDRIALKWATQLAAANLPKGITMEGRFQSSPLLCFGDVVRFDESFEICVCNPPFHASEQEAGEAARRKIRNLKREASTKPVLNFGGSGRELFCEGGERAFVARMITQSADIRRRCLWFTSLVSKSENLEHFYRILANAQAWTVKTIPMAQGQKKSRILAWTFLSPDEHARWREQWNPIPDPAP